MKKDDGHVKPLARAFAIRHSPGMTTATEREKRLAEALRQNLRRRKQQARGQDDTEGAEVEDPAGKRASPPNG